MRKRVFTLLLLVCFTFLLPVAGLESGAATLWDGSTMKPQEGDGSPQEPYQIGTAEELAWFAGEVNSGETGIYAELTGNIVLNNTGNWQSWAVNPPDNEWIPIGNSTYRFAGVFNGKGFTISGIYIGGGGTKGLFGSTGGGTIKNVNVTALYISGTSSLGGICGTNGGGTIENVRATASYISGSSFLGGICGANEDGTITGACYAGTVAGASTGAGGICGHNVRATVSNSYNSGTVSGVNSAGGVCGLTNSGAVIGCGNEGEIITNGNIGTAAAGGVCGAITSSAVSEQPSIIRDSYNAGTVRGSAKTGGVTGSIDSGGNRIEHCHNWGIVNGPADRTGSVCGWNSGEIMDCYYRAGSNAKGIGYGSGAVTEKTSAQFASGELAHLMGEPFGQTIGSGDYPVHRAADGSNVVYKLTYMSGETVHAAQYYNRGNAISVVTDPTAPEGLFFLGWVGLPGIMPAKDLVITAHFGPAEPPLITTESLPGVRVNEAYNARIEAEGTEPITFSVAAGSLPPGLSLGEGSGAITGTPTAYGVFTFTIRAAGPDGSHDERELSITVTAAPIITTSALPFGRPGEPYSCRITATGTTPITFEATGLPPGLAISAGGLISGVPEETGVYQVTVTANNNIPPRAEVTLDLIIKTAVWDGTMKQPASGNGTESNPYEIAAAEELAWFANRVNSGSRNIHAVLIADITLNDTVDWQDWANQPPENKWTPIGSGSTSTFMGTFRGNNHTVSGIYIDSPGSYQGLFGALGSSGRIENIGVTESYIRGLEHVGGVCGASYSGWIIDCSNAGIVSSFNPSPQIHYANAGGVCGNNTGGTIRGSYNTGLVDGSGHAVGGVCGANSGTVDTCYNAGTVSGSGSMYGGICGNNSATGVMIDVYNTGAAGSTGGNIGGICGHNMGAVTNAHSSGAGTGAFTFGGVCGTNGGNVENCYYTQADGIGYSLPQGTVAEVVRKTPVQFASGEVAYLLGAAFGQTLGAVPEPAPVFRAADPDNTVYRLTYLNGTVVCAAQYYNYGDTVTDPVTTGEIPPPASESGDFAGWAGLPPTMPAYDLEVAALFIQIPDAPGNLTATPGDGQVELTWSTPADNGGSAVLGYNVYRGGVKLNGDPLAALTYVDTGLTNGTSYEYTVKAVNAAGEGTGATVSAVPLTVPGAPGNLTATPGDEQVELTWSEPADNGGSAVLGYNVYRDGTKLNEDPLAALTYLDTGLANGTSYEYTVKAVNAAGEGTGATISAVPRTVPGAPAGLAAEPGDEQVGLTWSEPVDNGGSAILGYNVYRDGTKLNEDPLAALTYLDTGLANGTTYEYTVKAVNAAGEGTGATVSAIPRTVPGAPAGLAAEPGDEQVGLTWSAPADNGGSAILGYNIYRDGTKLNEDPLAALTYVDTGLTNGTSYEYTVAAVNVAGEGERAALATTPAYSYQQRTLTDSGSGISISGTIRRDSVLEVGDLMLHDEGECAACDEIRKYQNDDDYVFILGKEIILSHGFTGALTMTIEVGSRYNGRMVTILHCAGGELKTYTATVSGGKATFTVTELSPFALFVKAPPAPGPLPKTIFGGPTLLWWALSTAAAGLAVFFLLYRRRRLQK